MHDTCILLDKMVKVWVSNTRDILRTLYNVFEKACRLTLVAEDQMIRRKDFSEVRLDGKRVWLGIRVIVTRYNPAARIRLEFDFSNWGASLGQSLVVSLVYRTERGQGEDHQDSLLGIKRKVGAYVVNPHDSDLANLGQRAIIQL